MKNKKKKYAKINEDEYLNGTNNVSSANECTGIAPTKVINKNEAKSYTDIYDIPVNDTKKIKNNKRS